MRQDSQLSFRSLARRWFCELRGVLVGGGSALLDGVAAVTGAGVVRLTAFEVRRIARTGTPVLTEPLTRRRCRRYLTARWLVGCLGLGVLFMLTLYLTTALSMISAWLFGTSWALVQDDSGVSTRLIAVAVLPGLLLIFVTVAGVSGVAALDRWLATVVLGTDPQALLRQRVAELTSTRAAVIEAIDDERRRIERDLHDGVQQRLVALGLLIGRARRSSEEDQHQHLLRQAHTAATEAVAELREVASRVYPAVLDESGLAAALHQLAERSSVPVDLTYRLAKRPAAAQETVIYFVVSEALTNAVKHAHPARIEVTVRRQDDHIVVLVRDNGVGGANPAGPGLSGLSRRVAALDGAFVVDSPPGGPTVVEARVPCEWS